jgi:hypothetical protein
VVRKSLATIGVHQLNRYVCLRTLTAVLFVACAGVGAVAEDAAETSNASIRAFIEICVKPAPSFAASAEAAKAFGITELFESDGEKMGMTDDSALTVQIREGRSCTVTTDVQKDKKLTQQLLEAVARQAGGKPARQKGRPFFAEGAASDAARLFYLLSLR